MNEAALKALDLVEKGVATLGQHGPEVWERMVTYHLALTTANWGAALLASVIGFTLVYKFGLPSHRQFSDAKDDTGEVTAIARGVIGYLIGGLMCVFGTLTWLFNASHTIATLYAPDISLLLKLVEKASK